MKKRKRKKKRKEEENGEKAMKKGAFYTRFSHVRLIY
jgi:hypothetical protein